MLKSRIKSLQGRVFSAVRKNPICCVTKKNDKIRRGRLNILASLPFYRRGNGGPASGTLKSELASMGCLPGEAGTAACSHLGLPPHSWQEQGSGSHTLVLQFGSSPGLPSLLPREFSSSSGIPLPEPYCGVVQLKKSRLDSEKKKCQF